MFAIIRAGPLPSSLISSSKIPTHNGIDNSSLSQRYRSPISKTTRASLAGCECCEGGVEAACVVAGGQIPTPTVSLNGGLEPLVGTSVGTSMVDIKLNLVDYCRAIRRFEAKVWT